MILRDDYLLSSCVFKCCLSPTFHAVSLYQGKLQAPSPVQLLAMWTLATYLASLCLGYITYKLRWKPYLLHKNIVKLQWVREAPTTVSSAHSINISYCDSIYSQVQDLLPFSPVLHLYSLLFQYSSSPTHPFFRHLPLTQQIQNWWGLFCFNSPFCHFFF